MSYGNAQAATILAGDATINISGGELDVTSSTAPSNIGTLSLAGGTLAGAAQLVVDTGLTWGGGSMAGPGSTVVGANATATVAPATASSVLQLDGRSLDNQGTTSIDCSQANDVAGDFSILRGSDGAQVSNEGTLKIGSDVSSQEFQLAQGSGAPAALTNAGTFEVDAARLVTGWQVANQNAGQVTVDSGGELDLLAGEPTGFEESGSWGGPGDIDLAAGGEYAFDQTSTVSGNLTVQAAPGNPGGEDSSFVQAVTNEQATPASLSVGSVSWPEASLTIAGGAQIGTSDQGNQFASLSLGQGATTTLMGSTSLQNLTVAGGTLTSGDVDVAAGLTWTGGTMTGSGTTTLDNNASGSIEPTAGSDPIVLDGRTLANQGDLELDCDQATDPTGTYSVIAGDDAAELDNDGELTVNVPAQTSNAPSACALRAGTGDAPLFSNNGSVNADSGQAALTVGWLFADAATATVTNLNVNLLGGTPSGSQIDGTWDADGLDLESGGQYAISSAATMGDAADVSSLSVGPVPSSQGGNYQASIDALAGTDSAPSMSTGAPNWPYLSIYDQGALTIGQTGKTTTLRFVVATNGLTVAGGLNIQTLIGGNQGTSDDISGDLAVENGYYPAQSSLEVDGNFTIASFNGSNDWSGGPPATDTVAGSLDVTEGFYGGEDYSVDVGGDADIGGDLSMYGLTQMTVGNALSVGGNVYGNAALRVSGAMSVQQNFYPGDAAMQIDGGLTIAGSSYGGSGLITVPQGMTIQGSMYGNSGTIDTAGVTAIDGSYASLDGTFRGGGTVDLPQASYGGGVLDNVTLINPGQMTLDDTMVGLDGAKLENNGTIDADGGGLLEAPSADAPTLINGSGASLIDDQGTRSNLVQWGYSGSGDVQSGAFEFEPNGPVQYGQSNAAEPLRASTLCEDVVCATGDLVKSQTDLSVAGLGGPLQLTRTFNSELAAAQTAPGAFGYGWTTMLDAHLYLDAATGRAVVEQDDGSQVPFTQAEDGAWSAPAAVQATLSAMGDGGYAFALPNGTTLQFDAEGDPRTMINRAGQTTTFEYGSDGHIDSISAPSGRSIDLSYNNDGLVTSASVDGGETLDYTYGDGADDLTSVSVQGDNSAPVWNYQYGPGHLLRSVADGDGNATSFSYNPGTAQITGATDPTGDESSWAYSGGQTLQTAPSGSMTQMLLDDDGDPISITRGYGSPDQTTSTAVYNNADEMTSLTDGNGNTTSYGYDRQGNLAEVERADGSQTSWTYNAAREPTSETLASGEQISYAYNADGLPVSETQAASGNQLTRSWEYENDGELSSATDSRGNTTTYQYDSDGDLSSETDPVGNETTYTYDAMGRVASMTNADGNAAGGTPSDHTTAYTYSPLGLLESITDPLGHQQSFAWDNAGNEIGATAPDGTRTTYSYDADQRLIDVTLPSGQQTDYSYTPDSTVQSVTDANGNETTYSYNALNALSSRTDPLGRTTSYTYDAVGNLIAIKDAAGQVTTRAYGPTGELTNVSYSAGDPSLAFSYNAAGEQTSMTDSSGTSRYVYDGFGRLTSQADANGSTLGYAYDADGDITGIDYPDGHHLTRAFDDDDRLASVTDWLGDTTAFAYTPDSELATTTFPSSTSEVDAYTYDGADELSAETMTRGSDTLASIALSRNDDGQIESATQTGLPGPGDESYAFTLGGQLDEADAEQDVYDPSGNPTELEGRDGYNYDAGDELTQSPDGDFGYDALGQRTSFVPDHPNQLSFTYDSLGELTGVQQAALSQTDYSYDAAGQLVSATPTSGPVTRLTYDGHGLPVAQADGTTSEQFTWDLAQDSPLLMSDGTNDYLYGPSGRPFEQINGDAVSFLHTDQIGSIRLITDSSGDQIGATSYDAFGQVSGQSGSASTAFGFAGGLSDQATGFDFLDGREYDPQTGQYLAPAQTPIEPYIYANDDPIDPPDPSQSIGTGGVVAPNTTWEGSPDVSSENRSSSDSTASRERQIPIDAFVIDLSQPGIAGPLLAQTFPTPACNPDLSPLSATETLSTFGE